MDRLKEGIGLVAYAQRDPVMAYQQDGTDMFDEMVEKIHNQVVTIMCKSEINAEVERKEQVEESGDNAHTPVVNKTAKVGRNDPCPCGSGKKYKNCCGR